MTIHRGKQRAKILRALKKHDLGMTRLEIAKLLKLPKSVYITGLLDELKQWDLIVVKRAVDKRRRNVFIYFYNDLKGE